MRTLILITAALSATLIAGCFNSPSEPNWFDDDPYYDGYYDDGIGANQAQLNVSNTVLMGSVHGAEHVGAVYREESWSDPWMTSVDLHIDEGYWVMAGVRIHGDIEELEPGTYTFHSAQLEERWNDPNPDNAEPMVEVIVCYGEDEGIFDYDGPADKVTVTVTDLGDGMRHLEFAAENDPLSSYDWPQASSEGSTIEGEFDYVVVH